MNIIRSSSPMRSKPSDQSELETECLYGEALEVLDNFSEWSFGKLMTDNYYGWIKTKDLGNLEISTHRIVSKRSFLYNYKSAKSNCIQYLPLGAQLSVNKFEDQWAEVSLNKKYNQKVAYIPQNHLIDLNDKVEDWVAIAELLIDTPYKWGGRDTIGLDCSALLQLSCQTNGYDIPRNTISQIKIKNEVISNLNKLNRGFVVFWKGHVGIMVDKLNCIHANAFHMKTIIEPLSDIIFRMGKQSPIIKIVNLN